MDVDAGAGAPGPEVPGPSRHGGPRDDPSRPGGGGEAEVAAGTGGGAGSDEGAGQARLTILGSGTLLPDDRRRSAAHYLENRTSRLLLDCGPGTVHSLERFGIPWPELTHLVLSHYHTDHMGDLPGLLFALEHGIRPPRTHPLVILGPTGLYRRFGHLAGAFGDHVLEPGFEVVLVELPADARWEPPGGGFVLSCHATPHTDHSLAYRWEADGVAVGYTGDTGPSEEVAAFLAGCDVVVAECAFEDPAAGDNHLAPATLAEMARVMDPALLLVTHVYPPLAPEEAARRVAAHGFGGRVEAARDGTTVRLGAGGPELIPAGTRG